MKYKYVILIAVVAKIIIVVTILILISKPMDEVTPTYVNVSDREYTIILPVPTIVEQEAMVVEPTPTPTPKIYQDIIDKIMGVNDVGGDLLDFLLNAEGAAGQAGTAFDQLVMIVEPTPTPTPTPVFIPQPLPYPEYITVRVTKLQECRANAPFRVIEVPFKDYVKGVLANEWGANWTEVESFRAGAIAVKMYAWDAVRTGGKWGGYDYGIVYDCDWDMVYNPNITREITNKAVDDTWDTFITDVNNEPMRVHFLAWYGACANWLGADANCIGQWNSKADAENGMTYEEILFKYLNEPVLVIYYQEEK